MKVALLVLVLAACEHAEPAAKKAPPTPPTPTPIQQARAEFELLPSDHAVGTSKVYSRGDFLPDSSPLPDGVDEGDFIGRLRALFGPRTDDEYVLRHKKTGLIITAYSADSGPSYGGTPDQAGRDARRAADPLLQGAIPSPSDAATWRRYMRHLDDAIAGPDVAAVVTRLDALVSAVPPADWSTVKYYEDALTVYRVGAKDGQSFSEDLLAADGFAWLVEQPKSAEYDGAIISFYLEHADELPGHKPEAKAALAHLTTLVKAEKDPEMREALGDEVKQLAAQLH